MKKILLFAVLAFIGFPSLKAQKVTWGVSAGATTGVYTGKQGGVFNYGFMLGTSVVRG